MIRKSKWIEIHSPDERVAAVARHTLGSRLRLVWHFLPLAAISGNDDPEPVHQTRVATRRAMTTIEVFEHLLPRRRVDWFRKQLKRVRKACNDARDLDVLIARLTEHDNTAAHDNDSEHSDSEQSNGSPKVVGTQSAALQELLDQLADQRREAQQPVADAYEHLVDRHYKRRLKGLIDKLGKLNSRISRAPFGELAIRRMQESADDFFAAAQEDLHDVEALHRFRVQGKHLRYAMEVFAGAFRPQFRNELYPIIEDIQEQLGQINDHAGAQKRYQQWLCDTETQDRRNLLATLIGDETAAITQLHQDFLTWWTTDRADDLKRRFADEFAAVKS